MGLHYLTLHIASIMSRIIQGYGFKEADAVKQLKKNTRPILFIHGDADKFVPVCSAHEAYHTTHGKRQLLTVKGADHILSYLKGTAIYEKTVQEFLENYL